MNGNDDDDNDDEEVDTSLPPASPCASDHKCELGGAQRSPAEPSGARRSPAWRLAVVPAEMCNRCSQWDVNAFLIYVCVRVCVRRRATLTRQGVKGKGSLGSLRWTHLSPAGLWGPRDARKPSGGGRITANFSLLTFFLSLYPRLFAAFRRISAIKRERGFAKHS